MFTTAQLVFPVSNLHGDSSAELEKVHVEARSGVLRLIRSVEGASPNARDYYVQDAGALVRVGAERSSIVAALAVVAGQLLALAYEDARCDAALVEGFPPSKTSVPPSVHSNGTSAAELSAQARDAFRQAVDLVDQFRELVPNMRNYASMAEWELAREQHVQRVKVIECVSAYFLSVAQAIKAAASHSTSSGLA